MNWTIDAAHSAVEFSVKHMMIATVRGRFDRFSGTLNLNEEHPEQSYVEGVVEVASINTHDAQRDADLRSPNFFDVEKYPVMAFRSTRIEPVDEDHFEVVGDLTIKDVTRQVVFNVTNEGLIKDPWGNVRRGFSAETVLNRKDFGLNWNVALEAGGWLVGDKVKVAIEVEAIRQVAPADQKQAEAEASAV